MSNPSQIQSLVLQTLRLAKVPYIDPCTGLLVGDCNDTCGTGGSGGPTTSSVSFNPITNELTTVVNGVSSTTTLNLDSGDVVTTSVITVNGTPFAAGTSLQTVVNAIAALSHPAATLTNTNAAFSWNTATQVGNIPLSSSLVDNGDGTATFTKGDGSAPITINLGISTADAITTTNPIIIDGTTYPTGTSVEDILIDLQNSINFNISTGPDGVVTNATQTVTINPGDNIHFYSSNSTIDFDVTLGSAIVDGKVVNLFTTAPITVQGVTYVAGTSVFTILAALTAGTTYTFSDTPTINLDLTGNDVTGTLVGSDTATNGQVPQSDGAGGLVWVTPSAGHVAVTTADSTTVDFTQSGTDNQTITAGVKISNTAGNDITSDANGLFLDVQASETTTSITGTVAGHTIGTYTNEDAVATNINETVTNLVAAPDGFEYTNEDGTISTVTYLFDNTTPSAPVLLVQINGTTQASIPLNSYDVNITTTGGFAFNPLTDVITITETDGETHTIDLTPLRTTVTSIDSSVGIVQSVNPDGSTNYDLGVKSHSNETQAVSYTGTELPVITGVNIGDTVTTNFTNGVAHYTFDGTNWVLNFFVPASFAIDTLCDTTGTPVIVFADENGNLSYKNPDNTPYIGDPNLLENCCCTVSPIVSADANNDIILGSDGGAFYNALTATPETVTNITGALPTGQVIGTYTNEDGTPQAIRQTTYQSCDGSILSQDQKVHQVTNLVSQTGFGVVKFDGVDCLGHNDELYNVLLGSYSGNKSQNNNANGSLSRVLNGSSNTISSPRTVMSGDQNIDSGLYGDNFITGLRNEQKGYRSLISGSVNNFDVVNGLGVGVLNTGTYSNSTLFGNNIISVSTNNSSIGGTLNTSSNIDNTSFLGLANTASNVINSALYGQSNTYSNFNGVVSVSQGSNINTSSLSILASGAKTINNLNYGIIASQDGSITNCSALIESGSNNTSTDVSYSLTLGVNLAVSNSEQKITTGQNSQNLGIKTNLLAGFNTIIPAINIGSFTIGSSNYTVPNNFDKPTVFVPNLVIGASDAATILAPPTASTDSGIEGEFRLSGNYLHWYKNGQWNKSIKHFGELTNTEIIAIPISTLTNGLKAYCTDCVANDASTGVELTYQSSTSTWKKTW